MSQHDGLVDLSLPEPGALLSRREDLDGDVLAAPASPPHLAETALADGLHQLDLAGDAALHQERQPGARAARGHLDHVAEGRPAAQDRVVGGLEAVVAVVVLVQPVLPLVSDVENRPEGDCPNCNGDNAEYCEDSIGGHTNVFHGRNCPKTRKYIRHTVRISQTPMKSPDVNDHFFVKLRSQTGSLKNMHYGGK